MVELDAPPLERLDLLLALAELAAEQRQRVAPLVEPVGLPLEPFVEPSLTLGERLLARAEPCRLGRDAARRVRERPRLLRERLRGARARAHAGTAIPCGRIRAPDLSSCATRSAGMDGATFLVAGAAALAAPAAALARVAGGTPSHS